MSEAQAIGAALYDVLPGLAGVFEEKLARVRQAGTQETVEAEVTLDNGSRRFWNIVMSSLRDLAGHEPGRGAGAGRPDRDSASARCS